MMDEGHKNHRGTTEFDLFGQEDNSVIACMFLSIPSIGPLFISFQDG